MIPKYGCQQMDANTWIQKKGCYKIWPASSAAGLFDFPQFTSGEHIRETRVFVRLPAVFIYIYIYIERERDCLIGAVLKSITVSSRLLHANG